MQKINKSIQFFFSLLAANALLAAYPVLAQNVISDRSNIKVAQSDSPLETDNKTCICDPGDPFNPMAKMPAGPFQGQCLNNCSQRSVKLLSDSEAALYDPLPNTTVIANFNHKGKFWVAKIPKDAVEDVIFQIQYFKVLPSPYSAHGQIRFRLKPGYEAVLVPQSPSAAKTEIRLSDIVYSANAIWIQGGFWDPITGLLEFYAVAHEMVALEDRIQNAIQFKLTERIEQYRLALSAEQKQKLLENTLLQGDRGGSGLMYNTISRNCTTESFRSIDSVIQYNPKQGLELFVNIPIVEPLIYQALLKRNLNFEPVARLLVDQLDRYPALKNLQPTAPLYALKKRGLITNKSKMLNLESEFKFQLKHYKY